MNMQKLLPILIGLAMVTTAAQAGSTVVRECDDGKEDCPKILRLTAGGGDPRVVLLRNAGEDPTYVSLDRFMAQRGYLGVGLTDLTPELRDHFGVDSDYGVLVSRVEEDSPAAGAGLQVGDIITLVDGKEISGSHQLALAVRHKAEGDTIDLEVWRDGRPMTLSATAAQHEKLQIDLSGLAGLRGLGALGDLKTFGVDADAINKTVEEALKNLEHTIGKDGSFMFQFDPEDAEKFKQQWKLKFDGTTFPQKVESLQVIEEQMSERMRELEKRLQELEEQLAKEER
jgi:membrane-associated protease RseP (regulator of RpoE activity)